MPDLDIDILRKSVTQGDYADQVGGAYLLRVAVWNSVGALPAALDGFGLQESDAITLSTVDREALWAGAIAIAVSKVASLAWEVESDIQLRTRRGHELLMAADLGRGWVSFISKVLQDFLLTNNGSVIEVVHATTSINSQIVGLVPLDSMRCTRTGNPAVPVTYRDLKGAIHELKAGEVIEFADMPSSRASMFGSGKCAAFRAYKSIYKLACIEQYLADKVSGRRPLAINLINGLNDLQLQSVLKTAQSEADARGIISYMGAIIATFPGDAAPEVATINLADFPDNFDRQKEVDISILAYANNIGLDVQDLQPLTGRSLGTGAQSQVLDEKAKGKGLAAFRQSITHAINTWALPDSTTMIFVEKDWRDRIQNAQFNKSTVEYVTASVTGNVITAAQGTQALVDANVYPKEFLPVDETPDTSLSDAEKPEDEQEAEAQTPEIGEKPAVEIPVVEPLVPPVSKATTLELIEEEAKAAVELAKKIRKQVSNA
jgi:hypothetical protein